MILVGFEDPGLILVGFEDPEPTDASIQVGSEFLRLNEAFRGLSISLLDFLEENHVQPQKVRRHITILPLSLIKEAGYTVVKAGDDIELSKHLLVSLPS